MNNYFKSILGAELGKTPAHRGLTRGQPVYLFANVSGVAVIESRTTFSDAGTRSNLSLSRKLHNHAPSCKGKLDHGAIRSRAVYQQFKTLFYLYHLFKINDVPETLDDLSNNLLYARDTRPMRAVASLHTLEISAAESHAEDVVEVSIECGAAGTKVVVPDFDLQS